MPFAPKKPCPAPGCPELMDGGLCPAHPRAREHERGNAASRGYGERHRRWRLLVLAKDPICRDCEAHGRIVEATVADHITPLPKPNWWDGNWSIENGRGLCLSCHNRKTAREHVRGEGG
jgi:5-methylcytosine-specific restriction enzyme A